MNAWHHALTHQELVFPDVKCFSVKLHRFILVGYDPHFRAVFDVLFQHSARLIEAGQRIDVIVIRFAFVQLRNGVLAKSFVIWMLVAGVQFFLKGGFVDRVNGAAGETKT